MIDFSHVSQQYGERVVLSDITLHIKRGEFFVLVGPSGSGKNHASQNAQPLDYTNCWQYFAKRRCY